MYPDSEYGERAKELIPEWLYQWGEQQWQNRQYSQAIEAYNRIIRDYPDSEYGEQACAGTDQL